jgi:hypothetical protein
MMTMAQATENAGSVLTVPDMTPERPSRDKGLTRSYALENVLTQAETRTHHPAAAGQSDKNERIRTLDESEITSNDANEPAPKKRKGALKSMLEKNKAAGKEWARKRKEQGLDDDPEAIEGSDDPTTDEHQPMATEESGTESIVSDDPTPKKKTTTKAKRKAKGKARDAVQARREEPENQQRRQVRSYLINQCGSGKLTSALIWDSSSQRTCRKSPKCLYSMKARSFTMILAPRKQISLPMALSRTGPQKFKLLPKAPRLGLVRQPLPFLALVPSLPRMASPLPSRPRTASQTHKEEHAVRLRNFSRRMKVTSVKLHWLAPSRAVRGMLIRYAVHEYMIFY